MRRAIARLQKEQGQTLVWVAGGLTVLMIMLAFAIDIGTLQGERRHMQNAADAAALEAARARCFDPGVTNGAQAAVLGRQFAVDNYSSQPFAASETFTVTARVSNDWEFDAYATERVKLAFAGIFSSGQVNVTTHAAAACGGSDAPCGMFPLAFKQSIWDDVEDQCGQRIYVWTGELDRPTPQPNQPTPIPVSCTSCDCTTVYDHQRSPISGALALADTGRAWLDFTSAASTLNPIDCGGNNGCGQAEISCWIRGDSQVVLLKNSCVSGTNGIKFGAQVAINDRVGDYVNIPLFGPGPNADTEGRCTASGAGACDEKGFNIVDYACIRVEQLEPQKIYLAWAQTPVPEDPTAPNLPKYCTVGNVAAPCNNWCVEEKMLPVTVGCNPSTGVSMCETTCGKTSEGGDPGTGPKTISLID